ncbi:MAG: hypothetical protein Q9195_001729 [Heterodermia aff. obscurata]
MLLHIHSPDKVDSLTFMDKVHSLTTMDKVDLLIIKDKVDSLSIWDNCLNNLNSLNTLNNLNSLNSLNSLNTLNNFNNWHYSQLKVRCDVVPGNPDCRRCIGRKRPCEIVEPKRTRAKKADKAQQKMADMESKIQSLEQQLAEAKAEKAALQHEIDLSNNLSHSTPFTQTPFSSFQAPIQHPDYSTEAALGSYNLRAPHALENHDTLSPRPATFSYDNQSPNLYQHHLPAVAARYPTGQMSGSGVGDSVHLPAVAARSDTGPSLSSNVTNSGHAEDNEESLQASISDHQAKLEH